MTKGAQHNFRPKKAELQYRRVGFTEEQMDWLRTMQAVSGHTYNEIIRSLVEDAMGRGKTAKEILAHGKEVRTTETVEPEGNVRR